MAFNLDEKAQWQQSLSDYAGGAGTLGGLSSGGLSSGGLNQQLTAAQHLEAARASIAAALQILQRIK